MSNMTAPSADSFPPGYLAENNESVLIGVGATFIILNSVAFGLRVAARRIQPVPFGLDDVSIIVALILCLSVDIVTLLTIPYGGAGRHTVVVAYESPEKLDFLALVSLRIIPILWITAVNVSKCSLLLMYLRIFTTKFTRYLVYIIAAILAAHTIECFITTFFQCTNSLTGSVTKHENCLSTSKFSEYNSIPNIVTDVVMLVLPIPTVWSLKAPAHIKIGVTITFLTGSIGTLTSIIRLYGFFHTTAFADPCWVTVVLYSYTIAEPGTYFIAACLPTYRPLVKYLFGNSSATGTSQNSYRTGARKYADIYHTNELSSHSNGDDIRLTGSDLEGINNPIAMVGISKAEEKNTYKGEYC